jgi:hypothetical protein
MKRRKKRPLLHVTFPPGAFDEAAIAGHVGGRLQHAQTRPAQLRSDGEIIPARRALQFIYRSAKKRDEAMEALEPFRGMLWWMDEDRPHPHH